MDSVPIAEGQIAHTVEASLIAARAAAKAGNADAALAIYSAIHVEFPDSSDAYAEAAACLQRAQRFQEADTLLVSVLGRFPNAGRIWVEYALTALHRRDWNESIRRWDALRERFPERVEGYSFGVMALRESDNVGAAEELAVAAIERFPDDFRLRHEYGLAAHARRDWNESIRRWDALRERFPERVEGYSFGVMALRESDNVGAAEELAVAAIERFPDDFRLRHEYGLAAHARRDWNESIRRWDALRERFPERVEGYSFGVMALRESDNVGAAENLAVAAIERFPDDFRLWHEYGLAAHARRDWTEAVRRFTKMRERFPNRPESYSSAASSLGKAGQYLEMSELLRVATELFPDNVRIAVEQAWNACFFKNWPEAARQCVLIRERFPDNPDGYAIGTLALLRCGELDDAERIATVGIQRIPSNPFLLAQYAWAATCRRAWDQAMKRWQTAMAVAPADKWIIDGYAETRQAMLLDIEDQAIQQVDSVELPTVPTRATTPKTAHKSDETADPKLLLRFESLGDNCEFGLVQRLHGLEPLGLLRWATTYPQNLVALLETRFEGVGLPENTSVSIGQEGEWHAADARYFGMHTFIYDRTLDANALTRTICRRFAFLKNKLIEDLELGEKIYVYKRCAPLMQNSQLSLIHMAIRQYNSKNILLYVCLPEHSSQDCTVINAGDGIYIGYIAQLSKDPQAVRDYYGQWNTICRATWNYVLSAASIPGTL